MSVSKKTVPLTVFWCLLVPVTVWGQRPPNTGDAVAEEASAQTDMLQSTRYRQLRRSFDEWLSVQKLYTDEQVAGIQAKLERRVASMSAVELEDFLYDTEERLAVLMSDEAMDARHYLSFLSEEGRQRRIGGETPEVFDMTVSQLRQELRQFEQQRASRTAGQAGFNRLRGQRAAAVRQDQQSRQDAKRQAQRDRGAASIGVLQRNNPVRTQYAPRRDPLSRPGLSVGPWGGIYRSLP